MAIQASRMAHGFQGLGQATAPLFESIAHYYSPEAKAQRDRELTDSSMWFLDDGSINPNLGRRARQHVQSLLDQGQIWRNPALPGEIIIGDKTPENLAYEQALRKTWQGSQEELQDKLAHLDQQGKLQGHIPWQQWQGDPLADFYSGGKLQDLQQMPRSHNVPEGYQPRSPHNQPPPPSPFEQAAGPRQPQFPQSPPQSQFPPLPPPQRSPMDMPQGQGQMPLQQGMINQNLPSPYGPMVPPGLLNPPFPTPQQPMGQMSPQDYHRLGLPMYEKGGPAKRTKKNIDGFLNFLGIERDEIPAILHEGEYVLNKDAVDMIGKDVLDKVNAMPRLQHGGDPRTAHSIAQHQAAMTPEQRAIKQRIQQGLSAQEEWKPSSGPKDEDEFNIRVAEEATKAAQEMAKDVERRGDLPSRTRASERSGHDRASQGLKRDVSIPSVPGTFAPTGMTMDPHTGLYEGQLAEGLVAPNFNPITRGNPPPNVMNRMGGNWGLGEHIEPQGRAPMGHERPVDHRQPKPQETTPTPS